MIREVRAATDCGLGLHLTDDGLYAEAESRLTLAAPLTLLIFALAFRWTPWVLLTIPLPAVLVLYSFAKERAANES